MRSVINRTLWLAAVPVLLHLPAASEAQSGTSCSAPLGDACKKSEDLYTYLLPQLGSALAGGQAVLGSTTTLGGIGHFSVGVRASAVFGSLPDLDGVTIGAGPPVSTSIPTEDQFVPALVLDAAVGLYGGFPVGVTRVGAVDALVAFSYIPEPSGEGSDFTLPDGNTRIGFGARIGAIEESIVVPGVSLTYLRRPLPAISVNSTSQDGTTYGVESLEIDVSSWRLVASKSFLAFDLSAGFGGDNYSSTGFILASNPSYSPTPERISLDRDVTRSVWFVGVTLHGGPLHFGIEYGGGSGGSASTFNTFDPTASTSRNFMSVGLRVGL